MAGQLTHVTACSTTLDIGHAADHPSLCSKPHGHTIALRVGVQGRPDPELDSYVIDPDDLYESLDAIRSELHCRSLNDMIAPSRPTAAGLAGWVVQRLAMEFDLAFVEVTMGDISARVDVA